MTSFYRHVGGPDWINKDRFDIVAKLPVDPRQLPLVMRTFLGGRFKLKVHREHACWRYTLEVYTLELLKPAALPSATLKPTTLDCSASPQVSATPTAPLCRLKLTMGRIRATDRRSRRSRPTDWAAYVGGVVLDKTGRTGRSISSWCSRQSRR